MSAELTTKKREDAMKDWLKKPVNLTLIVILILALGLRLYFFSITTEQTLWWDEAEYGATAKSWALGIPYDLNPQRPPLFQFVWMLLFLLNLAEPTIKFLIVIIPSSLLVWAVYMLGAEMYNKKIGLIAALLTGVSWTLLFWSTRFQPDFFSMTFQVLSIYFMWKYWKTNKSKTIIFSGICAALGFHFKVSGLLVPMAFILFIFIKDRFAAFKNKNYYLFSIAFLLTLVPYFIWSYATFHTATAFTFGYIEPVAKTVPFGWYNLEFYYKLTGGPFYLSYILFILGCILALEFILYLDVLVKNKEKCFNPNIFALLMLVMISAFYIFHIKNTDDRWVFLWLPFIFMLIGKSVLFISEKSSKIHKYAPLIMVFVLLVPICYVQIKQANDLIIGKKDSYMPVKLAGEWVKQNYEKTDKVLSISYTQSVYYTERNVTSYSLLNGTTGFDAYLQENKPTLLQVSVFEPHPPWIFDWTQQNADRLTPVQAYFADAAQQQPVLIVYKINYPA